MTRSQRLVIALAASLCLLTEMARPQFAQADPGCQVAGQAGQQGILVHGYCYKKHDIGGSASPRTKTIPCGQPPGMGTGEWNPQCGRPQTCLRADKASGKAVPTNAFATLTYLNGRWANPVIWCPAQATPAPTVADIRDQVLRLLPPVAIGAAWSTTTLVNAETILWAATAPGRDLGTVTVVGHRVRLRLAFRTAHWAFGDNSTDTTSSPGKAYNEAADPCRTAQCPHYYGHTYRTTGTRTLRLTIDWHAQYDTGTGWTDIPGTLTGPETTHHLTVKQARGILIPNP